MKLKITLIGKVHDVGYRLFLLNQADSLLINRFDARNVVVNGKQALIILVEGDEEQVKDFLEFVKSEKPERAVVDEIRVEEYKGSVRTIESYRNSLMLEQMNKLVQTGLGMLEKQDTMLGKMDLMLEKQDKMLEKQDEMLGKMDLMLDKQDTMLGKMDLMLEKQDKTIEVIREESKKTREEIGGKVDSVADKIDLLRVDMKEYMEQRFRKIENEIEKIKAKIGLS